MHLHAVRAHHSKTRDGQIAPHRKRWFAAFTLILIFLLMLLLEGALRLAHYGGEYDLVARRTERGKDFLYINPSVGKRYFDPARYFLPKVEDALFEADKSPNTFRVFCLGASTTAGFPYSYNLTPSNLLKKQLERLLPGRRIEVINAGLTATSSYTVVEFARELAELKPDAFVVYSGQNEFYGALAVGSTVSIGQWGWMTRSYLSLRRLKSFILFESALNSIAHWIFGAEGAVRDGTLMQQMAKEKAIAYDSPMYRRAMDAYRHNLEDMLAIAEDHGIPVVLSTLVTNERSLPPFVSLHDEHLSDAEKAGVETLVARGDSLRLCGGVTDALVCYRQAAQHDPSYAMLQYRIGECYEQTGFIDSARQAYGAARDLDGLRFRASADANGIIRSLGRMRGVAIADVDSVFRAHSPDGIPGKELLWEHVHPTHDGYVLLALSWMKAMASIRFPQPDLNDALRMPVTDSLVRSSVCSTELDKEFGAQIMAKLLMRWPFHPGDVPLPVSPDADTRRAAAQFVSGSLRWSEAHYERADAYLKEGRLEAAEAEYAAVHAYDPDDPFPLVRMGDMLALLGRNAEAIDALNHVLAIKETQFVHLKMGVLSMNQGAPERALEHLSRAFELDAQMAPHFSPAQFEEAAYQYALALSRTGNKDEARQTLAQLLEHDPAHAKARQLWKELTAK